MSLPSLETLSISDSPPPSSSPSRDRFTTLPPELFDYICDIMYEIDLAESDIMDIKAIPTHLGSVSRAFLHGQRSRRFKKVSITKDYKFDDFYRIVLFSTGCRAYVEEVEFSYDVLSQHRSPSHSLKNEQLVTFLHHLPSLRSLKVHDFPNMTKLLTNPPRWFPPLPGLEILDIADEFKDWDDPFDPMHWSALDLYPSLTTFRLKVSAPEHARPSLTHWRWIGPILEEEIEPIFSVETLHIEGWFSLSPYCVALLEHFPNVSDLSLSEPSSEHGNVCQALDRFPGPDDLLKLAIKGGSTWIPALEEVLPRYWNLTDLSLQQGTYDSTLIPILKSDFPNLRRLYFGDEVNSDDLRLLVGRRSDLEEVWTVEMSVSQEGNRRNLLSPISDEYISIVEDLVKLASTNGIELDGSTIRETWRIKRKKIKVEKARSDGSTYQDLALDEFILSSREMRFNRTQELLHAG